MPAQTDPRRHDAARFGVTLLEVILVIAIFGIMLGLLIPAVQKARASAVRMQSKNQLRQIILATHNFASVREGRLPSMNMASQYPDEWPVLTAILDYVEAGQLESRVYYPPGGGPSSQILYRVRLYQSPADPSISFYADDQLSQQANCSYAINMSVFGSSSPHLARTFSDGTSNTIAFGEHYARCSGSLYDFSEAGVAYIFGSPSTLPPSLLPPVERRATFADGGWGDVVPITTGTPPTSVGTIQGKTFQIAPRLQDCDPTIPQAPHRSGMLAAFADGSVRTISGSVAVSVFWAAVTPSSGEVFVPEW